MKFSRHRSASLYHHAFHVYRDWLVFIIVVIVLSALTALFHLYLFFQVRSEEAPLPSGPSEQATVDRSVMKATIDEYSARREEFETKKTVLPTIVDPSR